MPILAINMALLTEGTAMAFADWARAEGIQANDFYSGKKPLSRFRHCATALILTLLLPSLIGLLRSI